MPNQRIARFPLADGGSVLVEVDVPPGVAPAGRTGEVMRDVRTSFENAFGEVRDAAASVLALFSGMATAPDEVELKFSIKLDAEVGAIIARTGVQGQFEVKLRWCPGEPVRTDEVEQQAE